MTVDIFIPCFIDQFYPETGMNMVKVLRKAGVKVHYNPEQTCCGQMAFNSGFSEEAQALGTKFLKDFNNDRSNQELFYNSAYHLEYKRVAKNVIEITDFLVNKLGRTDFGAVFPHKVTFHDSCAGLREYRLKDEARQFHSHGPAKSKSRP